MDYRPALRARTGAGEYVHQIARAWRLRYPADTLTLFTSSRKDRPDPDLASSIPGARLSDHRIPVQLLNFLWHRLEWPKVERLTGPCDVAFSPHPLLLPSRAAQVVTIHDLDFLKHPERTVREIRRDYPVLAASHARRAHAVIVPSEYTAQQVSTMLSVARDRIAICPPGLPAWRESPLGFRADGYLLFIGTIEQRKNIPGLLSAYARLLQRRKDTPRLVLAGKVADDMRDVLNATGRPPLTGRVELLGYVADERRQEIYAGARALVVSSFDEGFGMPALEAMSLGIPVVASDRGALPEVIGDAGLLVNPDDEESMAAGLEQVLNDDTLATALSARGRTRAAGFSWDRTADRVRAAFVEASRRRAPKR